MRMYLALPDPLILTLVSYYLHMHVVVQLDYAPDVIEFSLLVGRS